MKANELRIGNWVNEFMIPTQIDSRMLQKIESANERGKIIIDLSYIPLTPEVLEKCGFETKSPVLAVNSDGDCFYLSDTNIKYLHEFQDAYRIYSGKELTYTP